ncbi:MAG: hypothetical protein WD894_11885 [Pirellulales bacterium]
MHGNVWEWCSDLSASGYYAMSPRDDPLSGRNISDDPLVLNPGAFRVMILEAMA